MLQIHQHYAIKLSIGDYNIDDGLQDLTPINKKYSQYNTILAGLWYSNQPDLPIETI
jgi:hypothetical protein